MVKIDQEELDLKTGFRKCAGCKNWFDKNEFKSVRGQAVCETCSDKKDKKDKKAKPELHNWNGDAIYC